MIPGSAFRQEKQKLLFEAFSQVDSSTTRQYGGSGLGLAICRKLVNAMGGEIGVESVPGIGSCFWFEIPLALGDAPLTEAPARQELVAGPKRRVLLVEDVELNQVLIADMLRSHGHEVTLASERAGGGRSGGAGAVRCGADGCADAGDGRDRGDPADPETAAPACEVPVLALSANVMAEDQARYMAAGMNGALAKPVDWPELFNALARYGGADKAAAQNEATRGQGADITMPRPDAAGTMTPAHNDRAIDPAALDRLRRLGIFTERRGGGAERKFSTPIAKIIDTVEKREYFARFRALNRWPT